VKVFPLKLQNKFEGLEIDDSDTDIVDTGCTTPMNGVSPTEHGAAKACLIPRQKNYIVTISYVKRFISKLKERISWLKPKHYFVRTVRPQSELMINIGLRTMDTHHMVDMKALLDSGATGMFIDKRYIRPTKSPQTSPVFFIPKKDGKKRMVQDYRYLNKGTIKNNYPLPLILELIDCIGNAKVFTKLDLRWGYNNVHIKEGDKWKAAFTCQDGAFWEMAPMCLLIKRSQ